MFEEMGILESRDLRPYYWVSDDDVVRSEIRLFRKQASPMRYALRGIYEQTRGREKGWASQISLLAQFNS